MAGLQEGKSKNMRVHTTYPDWKIECTTRKGEHFVLRAPHTIATSRFLEDPTSKASIAYLGKNFNEMEVPGVAGKTIKDVLSKKDLIEIKSRDALGNEWLEMVGTINDIVDNPGEDEGVPVVHSDIQVEGVGVELMRYHIFWHAHIAARANLGGTGYLARSKGRVPGGRPEEVLSALLDTFFNDKYIFRFANGELLSNMIAREFEASVESLATLGLSALGMEGPLWQTLKRYCDAPWHELFMDIPNEKANPHERERPTLYFRPTPFDIERWEELKGRWGFEYHATDRLGTEQISSPVDGVYNFFWVPGKGPYTEFDQRSMLYDQSGGKLPIYDDDSIRRYGLRRLEMGTEYVQLIDENAQKFGSLTGSQRQRLKTTKNKVWELLELRTKQLQRWFGYEDFEQGTIPMRHRAGMDPKHGIRMGGILMNKANGKEYYIRGVEKRWMMGQEAVTTAHVLMGRDPKDYQKYLQRLGG